MPPSEPSKDAIELSAQNSHENHSDTKQGDTQDIREKIRLRIDKAVESLEDKERGKWTRRGCTPWSFAFTDSPDVNPHEKQAIKARHLHTIAAGGCVGAGLFVGAGSALAYGGPAAMLIGL